MQLESFAFYISVLRKQFVSYCSEKLAEVGLTYGQLYIIIYIGRRKECSPKEISTFLRLDAGHINRTLSKLIESGHVIQEKNPRDKRANIVSLTEKGKEVFKMSYNLFRDWDRETLSSIDDDEKEKLMDVMKEITLNLKKQVDRKGSK